MQKHHSFFVVRLAVIVAASLSAVPALAEQCVDDASIVDRAGDAGMGTLNIIGGAIETLVGAGVAAASRNTRLLDDGLERMDRGTHRWTLAIASNPSKLEPEALEHLAKAARLAELRRQGGDVCVTQAFQVTIVKHLVRAVRLDDNAIDAIRENEIFEVVRTSLAYNQLMGLERTNEVDLAKILKRVKWNSLAGGAFGPEASLDFRSDGKVTRTQTVFSEATSNFEKVVEHGTYNVHANSAVTISIGGKKLVGMLGSDDKLQFQDPTFGIYNDDQWECEA